MFGRMLSTDTAPGTRAKGRLGPDALARCTRQRGTSAGGLNGARWSIGQFIGQSIDQFPHGSGGGQLPPFKGALTACHPQQLIDRVCSRRADARMNTPRPAPPR